MFSDYIKKTYHRNLLEKLLREQSTLIKGKILDIGSKSRRYDFLFQGEVVAADIVPNKELNVEKQDIIGLSYPAETFDGVICLEVLQYLELENFSKAIFEIKRVLKKDGTAIITCPFYYKAHQDNLRITGRYIAKILSKANFKEQRAQKFGNKHTAVFDILRYSFWDKTKGSGQAGKFFYSLYYLSRLLFKFWIIKMFSLEKTEDDFYSGLFITLRK